MSWQAFGKRVRRLTLLVIITQEVGALLSMALAFADHEGGSLGFGLKIVLLAAILVMLRQSVRGLRMINRLIPQMDTLQANWGGLLIPDPEQGHIPEQDAAAENPADEIPPEREVNPFRLTHHLML
jgi:hypothetical protein